jgi:hypothetical protein
MHITDSINSLEEFACTTDFDVEWPHKSLLHTHSYILLYWILAQNNVCSGNYTCIHSILLASIHYTHSTWPYIPT